MHEIVVCHVQYASTMLAARTLEEFLPADLQVKASLHFTPPPVARRIAKLLAPDAGSVVLDVGSGAGLFCVAAALARRDVRFVGVEWRARLVDVANALADRMGAHNATFVLADALDLDWSAYDAFYFYNPFAEHIMESPFVIDRSVALDPNSYLPYIEGVQDKLARLPRGSRVATFHGFGGEIPDGYVLVTHEPHGSDRVEIWLKRQ